MRYVIVLGFVAMMVAVFAYQSLFSVSEYQGEQTPDEVSEMDGVTVTEAEMTEAGEGSLASLMAAGRDLECEIVSDQNDQVVRGNAFFSNGMMRGDFMVLSPDLSGEMLTSMIITDTNMYIWTDWQGEAQGIEIDLATMDELSSTESSQPVDIESEVSYTCSPWSPVSLLRQVRATRSLSHDFPRH